MPMQRVDLTDAPSQSFIHTLLGIEYKFNITWNDTQQVWTIDVQNNLTGDSVMFGAAILGGVNILVLLPPYTLEAYFISDTGLFIDPLRDNLASGHFYLGDAPQ